MRYYCLPQDNIFSPLMVTKKKNKTELNIQRKYENKLLNEINPWENYTNWGRHHYRKKTLQ